MEKQEFEDDYLNTLAWLNPGDLRKAIREAKKLIKAARHDRVVIYSNDQDFRVKVTIIRREED